MLDSEPSNRETENNEPTGRAAVPAAATDPAPVAAPAAPAVPAAVFQPPQVLFQPPAPPASDGDYGDRAEPEADGVGRTSRTTRTTRTRGRAATSASDVADDESGDSDGGRPAPRTRTRGRAATATAAPGVADAESGADGDGARPTRTRTRGGRGRSRVRDTAPDDDLFSVEGTEAVSAVAESDYGRGVDDGADAETSTADDADEGTSSRRSRRRRSSRTSRTRRPGEAAAADGHSNAASGAVDGADDDSDSGADDDGDDSADGSYADGGVSGRRRRRKRRRGSADTDVASPDDPPDTVVHVRAPHNPADDVRSIKGSTRLEAKKQRRREGRESGRRRPPVVTESEFLARRESVERTMVVRQRGDRTQIAVLEDDVLVEHYVNRTTHQSYVGNVYLGKVQNVLPSMEAAFVDIGKGRNAVLYAGEVNFDASGLEGQPKRIESALKAGQSVIVQVTKDPVGHKGARLTSQVSLPGRYLVYVPGASMTGISRKLPENERTRLKAILKKVTPEHAGVIVRTAAEGAAEAELDRDITRLAAQWETIEKKAKTASAPALLYGEPDLTVRVIRDVFNEDFAKLIVSGDEGWEIIDEYVRFVAPHLADRISRWDHDDDPADDVFAAYRIDEQLAKALERKVWLPSGGSLVIDRTEAMTVIDVNTGKFTGQGGNLEETVTRNNLEAAEEIVRQLRLRDVGGIVVIDFIDMVLESNRDLVLRRLLECLARDRTKHQVAEVTSLGLVQMTRKRVGAGLLEAFSQQCECCSGRGVILTLEVPTETAHRSSAGAARRPIPAPPARDGDSNGHGNGNGRDRGNGADPRPANGRSGNRRPGGRSDNDWRSPAETAVAETTLDDQALDTAALDTAALGDASLDSRTLSGTALDSTALDSTALDSTAVDGTVSGAAAVEDTAAGESTSNGGRRTRRPTNGGTAFATAVHVDDSPAPAATVPVVTMAPEAQPEPSGFTSVVTGDSIATEDSAPPVRRTRTRAGSAVARVTIVSDPEPQAPAARALPETQAEPEAPATEPDPVTPDPEHIANAEPEAPAAPADLTDAPAPAEPEAITEAEPELPAALVLSTPPEVADEPWATTEAEPELPAAVVLSTAPEVADEPEEPADAPASDALAVAESDILALPVNLADTQDPITPEANSWQEPTADASPAETAEAPASPDQTADAEGEASPTAQADAAGEAWPEGL